MFDWEHGIALHEIQGIGHHLSASGKSEDFSRVAAGSWGMFSSYSRDGHSKFPFVQRSQDSCLVRRET